MEDVVGNFRFHSHLLSLTLCQQSANFDKERLIALELSLVLYRVITVLYCMVRSISKM